jgi:anthranilate synthase component I
MIQARCNPAGIFFMVRQTNYSTHKQVLPADLYTPVGVFLKLRDVFQDSVLLESSDFHAADNSFSYIGLDPLSIFSIEADEAVIRSFHEQGARRFPLQTNDLFDLFDTYQHSFHQHAGDDGIANGLLGYISYNAVRHFDRFDFQIEQQEIPDLRFIFYRYVIAFNHYLDQLVIYENIPAGEESHMERLLTLIRNRHVAVFPFNPSALETSSCSDEQFLDMTKKGIAHCLRGDVFQVVLSRRFSRSFTGDDFGVYRMLRTVNPSPYLFYFDYGDFRMFGSSPEAQLVVKNGVARINPIAGTFKRTGNDQEDKETAQRLIADPKENAEHVMLVDLARNDLSRHASEVQVEKYREVHYYSHVIHLVSQVIGKLNKKPNSLRLLADSFPAGTLSGAPKHKAINIIQELEPHPRGFYGGCAGFIGFNGDINTTIVIRTFLSMNNSLHYQAGAGIVAASSPLSELAEVGHKLGALRKAIELAKELKA